jgi:carboxyl-terminal processing protease
LKRNGGILVLEVVEGSPASNAGVLPGDVLLAVGSERIQFVEQYLQALNQYQGTTVMFTFDRNGTLIEKQIPIRPYPSAAH